MPGGNDIHSETMTIADAKKWCESHPECEGFTFAGNKCECYPCWPDWFCATIKAHPVLLRTLQKLLSCSSPQAIGIPEMAGTHLWSPARHQQLRAEVVAVDRLFLTTRATWQVVIVTTFIVFDPVYSPY